MIILATVIILSLDSSNIIERANEAKESTNLANLKEAANVALAEYKLEVSLGNINSSEISANEYVKDKLEEQGIDASTMVVNEEGKILTGLTEVAVAFIEAGVPVGTSVTGYDLTSNTRTTYATSGKENTAPDYTETDPTTQNVARATTISWKYIGISENGKALIALDTVTDMPTITLSGKGGYVNGPAELDLACDALYSSDMGRARSMDMDDVNMILGTNPVEMYMNTSGSYVENEKELTVGELVAAGETALSNILTPDGKDINTYVPNYFDYVSGFDEWSSDIAKKLVYQSTEYWLAHSSVEVNFRSNSANFYLHHAVEVDIFPHMMFDGKEGLSDSYTHAIRPVVELASDVGVTYNGTTVTLSK